MTILFPIYLAPSTGLLSTTDPGSGSGEDICFVVYCYWSRHTILLSNGRQTSVRWSDSKISPALPSPQGIHYSARTLSAVESRAEMGKMQVLGVVAVILAVYCVHANVYLREEFLDGGKFGILIYSTTCAGA